MRPFALRAIPCPSLPDPCLSFTILNFPSRIKVYLINLECKNDRISKTFNAQKHPCLICTNLRKHPFQIYLNVINAKLIHRCRGLLLNSRNQRQSRSLNLNDNQSTATDVSIFNKDKSWIIPDTDSALATSAL